MMGEWDGEESHASSIKSLIQSTPEVYFDLIRHSITGAAEIYST
jgi:hypothetical protein